MSTASASRLSRVVTAIGLGAVGFGLVSVALRETFGFSVSYTFVTLVGLLAVAQGLRAVSGRRRTDGEATETGDPELRYRVATPGDDFDRLLGDTTGWSLQSVSRQHDVRDRLNRAAVDALVTYEHCTAEEARARIETGGWTDDQVAASLLSDSVPSPSLRLRLRRLFTRESGFAFRVARTVDAIHAVQEGRR